MNKKRVVILKQFEWNQLAFKKQYIGSTYVFFGLSYLCGG